VVDRWISPSSKYKGKEHCELLIELMGNGKTIAAFCAELNIGRSTFHSWLEVHPELAEAYEVAKEHGLKWWEEMPARYLAAGLPFKERIWKSLMINNYGYTNERLIKLTGIDTASGPSEKADIVLKQIASGKLTGKESKDSIGVVKDVVDIYATTDLVKRMDALEKAIDDAKK
jgi:hypothetical protein